MELSPLTNRSLSLSVSLSVTRIRTLGFRSTGYDRIFLAIARLLVMACCDIWKFARCSTTFSDLCGLCTLYCEIKTLQRYLLCWTENLCEPPPTFPSNKT